MAKIITVTFNPCVDKSTTVQALAPERKLQCSEPAFEPGGGGLNVARAIRKLGGEAIAIYPSGGYSGNFLNELMTREGVPVLPIQTEAHTRENLIVLDRSTNQQYRFGMPGSVLQAAEWEKILSLVEAEQADYVIASGSLPPGVPVDIFGRLSNICKGKGAKLVVDTSGEALRRAVEEGVFLFKPNLGELSSLVGREEVTNELVDDIARQILERDKCEAIVVSLGAIGARLITKTAVVQVIPPVVRKVSTVGAGDSMVAGIVLGLSRGWNLKEALQYGVACGTAATMNPGTQLCKLEDVAKLFDVIRGSGK